MGKSNGKFDLRSECKWNLKELSAAGELEAACKYEYMRESQALRDEIENSETNYNREFKLFNYSGAIIASRPRRVLPSFAYENLRASERYHLAVALQKAGFSKPWNTLRKDAQRELVSLVGEWDKERKKSNPPVVVEAASPEPDEELNYDPDRPHNRIYWRLKPSEPELLQKQWPGHPYFFGFIRVDEERSQTEMVEAFTAWVQKRYARHKKGNPQWIGKLNQLAAMRVRHHYPRSERRVILLSLTSKKTYKRGINETEPDTGKMDVGLSRDCREAREFFQTLFHGQEPISFLPYMEAPDARITD
jgi:hypothetical protein